MRRLIEYRLFESSDEDEDVDVMAKFQIFGSDAQMAFNFNKYHVTNTSDIKDLIQKYNQYYIQESSWGGGPPPRGFVKYYNEHYGGNATLDSFYPTIDLLIQTVDCGTLIVGFSVIKTISICYQMFFYI